MLPVEWPLAFGNIVRSRKLQSWLIAPLTAPWRAVCMLCLSSRHAEVLSGRTLAAAGPYCCNRFVPVRSEWWVNCKESIYSWRIACHLARSLAL